jgi:ribosomal-protein-serine acetyltransferase
MFSHRIDEKVELVLPDLSMVGKVCTAVRSDLEHLQPWMPWATEDYSEDSAREFIQRTLRDYAESGRFDALICVDKQIVGSIGFHNFDAVNRSAHIGYWISRKFEGQGIVSRSCRALIEYLFEVRQLNRLQINCNVENVRSRAIPERLGFKLEGIHRQVEFLNGRFGDWAIYGLLREEWENNNSDVVGTPA